MTGNYWIYLVVMTVTTYAVRALPFAVFTKKIRNRFFKSFLTYVPYAVLSAMTVPTMLYATDSIWSALVGLVIAIVLSMFEQKLMIVALASCVGVYIMEWII